MAGTGSKWLIGCGIGCGLVILVFVALGAGSYFLIKTTVEEAEKVDAGMDRVTERFGRITEFTPDPDGVIRRERLEAFLAARESMAPAREEMEGTLALLSRGAEDGVGFSPAKIFWTARAGFRLLPEIMDFYNERNEALLEAGIGLGEYYYIYAVAYYAWLGKSPADGPPFVLTDRDDEDDDEDWDAAEVREHRLEQTLRGIRDQLLPMLRNQLARLEQTGGGEAERWREDLAAEIDAMEADPYRLPWRDGLPRRLEASLEPFRERLEESYSYQCNALETGVRQH